MLFVHYVKWLTNAVTLANKWWLWSISNDAVLVEPWRSGQI